MSQETEGIIIYSVTDGVSSDHTKNNYRKTFRHFLNCSQLNEGELLTRAQKNPRLVEAMVIKHIKHMAEKQKLKHGTIDKSQTSHHDLLDGFRLACLNYELPKSLP